MLDHSDEINFDGLIGPTHNYSGLSFGNMASMKNSHLSSNPKKAALQGLEKMKTLHALGIKQAILPPQERPFIPILRTLGYTGSDSSILQKVKTENPALLFACCSSSSMWTANAATITPSPDSFDKKVHFTPANLISKFHRSFEAPSSAFILRRIFDHPNYFMHHDPLPSHSDYSDEGAANHTRFCSPYSQLGIHLFVYGKSVHHQSHFNPQKFPPRQSDEASKAIARLHQLSSNQLIFAQQNPEAIDTGVFHNDVISVGNQNVFLYHEKAFIKTDQVIDQLKRKFEEQSIQPYFIPICEHELSLEEAVKTYFFNSQLVTLPDQMMAVIAPKECEESFSTKQILDRLVQTHPRIKKVIYQDIRESMQNGGGPACLRLRIVLNQAEQQMMLSSVLFTDKLYQELVKWIHKYYRDRLSPDDLADPQLLQESREALDELTTILKTGPLYPFQLQHLPPLYRGTP
jgi:succinylarginine dihydrolase